MIPARLYEHPIESLLAVALLLGLLFASADNTPAQASHPIQISAAAKS
jgi:hypothetical protein